MYKLKQKVTNAAVDIGLTLGENGLLFVYADTKQGKTAVSGKEGDVVTVSFSVQNIYAGGVYYVVSSLYSPLNGKAFARNRKLAKVSFDELPVAGMTAPEYNFKVTGGK
jgi:hypothetical protein